MKTHTNKFKNQIKELGRELHSFITYSLNNKQFVLTNEDLDSISFYYDGNILKSVMKRLDFECNVNIPQNTILNYKFGIKIDNEYEYLNFGTFVVYSSEKSEDNKSYRIVCRDKMINAMKTNEDLNIVYPITIKEYIIALCNKLELVFANKDDTFANYDKIIENELYVGLDYTYRDILDELAQVTASTICINSNDELEIRYITDTNDTINAEYLNDTNVNFGEKYGPINSIVLSRGAKSDNVYLQDEESVKENGLCEIKIVENQIMNWNDRSNFLPQILERLNGLEYYVNDFSSKGICYYDLCDKYKVAIGDMVYSCVMLNDEINVTTGLEEIIYTELPNETVTDYTKADKTDRRIKQTYLMVDKQNQLISAAAQETTENTNKIAQQQITLDTIQQQISGEYGMTAEETANNQVFIEDALKYYPLEMTISGYSEKQPLLYPSSDLYPGNNIYPLSYNEKSLSEITICVDSQPRSNPTENLKEYVINIEEPLRSLNNIKDKLEIKLLEDGTFESTITRYLKNTGSQIVTLDNPITKKIEVPKIELLEHTNYIYIKESPNYEIYIQYLIYSEMNRFYATKIEMNAAIKMSEDSINLELNQKVDNKDFTNAKICMLINDGTSEIKIDADKLGIEANDVLNIIAGNELNLTSNNMKITSDNFNVDENGNMSCTSGTFAGTVNTGQNLTVGNNAYIGQNQSSTSLDRKFIYLSDVSYIRRTKVGSSENLSLNGQFISLNASENIQFSKQPDITSDKRLKQKIKDVDVSFIDKLKVKEFEYKNSPNKKQIGLIAQDYLDKDYSKYFLSSMINENDEEFFGIQYGNITNALIKYCQELKREVINLKKEIEVLKNER